MIVGIKQLRDRFASIDLPVDLTVDSAAALKAQVPRERLLQALARVENFDDAGARAFLVKTLVDAGLLPDTHVPRPQVVNAAPRQAQASVPARTAAAPHAPQHPAIEPVRTDSASNHVPAADHRSAPGDNPAPTRSSWPAGTTGNGRRPQRPSHHAYGGKAAIMFELDETKAGVATVALDGARAIAERQYDWKDKVRIQLTMSEVPVVAATLFGLLPKCQFANHGPDNDKGFEIEWQGERGSFFVKVWQGKGNLRAVPMTREDAFHVGQIVLRAIQQASPARLDATGALNSLRALYARK